MTDTPTQDPTAGVAENFSGTARDYDAVVRHNLNGAQRLVASLPQADYRRVLDVGCGTGWASLAMVQRFPSVTHVTGVDPATGMLATFRAKEEELPGVELDLRPEGVTEMTAPPDSFDAVISSMAFHWFPDKPGAVAAMARMLVPGGVMGILASGAGGEHEFRRVLHDLGDAVPPEWDAAFDVVQRDVDEMERYLLGAGLTPLDIWMERRIRHTTPEAYLERMRVVAGHIAGATLSDDEVAALLERVRVALHEISGSRGFEYTFTKLYAVARLDA